VTLIFDEGIFKVSELSLRQSCDAPALLGVSSYRVRSPAPASIVHSFIEALNGTNIKITNENVLHFSQLSSEFGFWVLSAKISDFCNSPEHQIWWLKSNISKQTSQIVELETAIKCLTCLIGDFGSLIQCLDSKVTELSAKCPEMDIKVSEISRQVGEVHAKVRDIDRKVNEVDRKGTELATRAAEVDTKVAQVNTKVAEVNTKVAQVDTKVAQVDNKTNQLRSDISVLKILKEPHSRIVGYFPPLFEEFRMKCFNLLWRGSRDGFTAKEFHRRCDGRTNTLTLILDTDGNVFGGFTPVE
jgi:outer membrane murein-binding lipoprotein Lpp